ncbi:hypothetical protein SAMN02799630_02835 [Paenibacillus sp. UNCCL117]|nr:MULTISPECIES: hypothetical protein [unclassified Paenibacillus]SDD28611.1 hypothetical protein SAMN04488602_107156 [Paenibacillus sp. cl123]SFW40887.1 hypothetical protein SAMN02799630_02835 [Paenibacillus sp. UNCCL117]
MNALSMQQGRRWILAVSGLMKGADVRRETAKYLQENKKSRA